MESTSKDCRLQEPGRVRPGSFDYREVLSRHLNLVTRG